MTNKSAAHNDRAGSATLRFFRYPNYWEMDSVEVHSYEQLSNELDRLVADVYRTTENPALVFVQKADGDRFGIGIGWPHSTVIFIRRGREYWYSVGDRSAEGYAVFLCPDWTEISAKRVVTHEQARVALRAWLDHGAMADAFEWTNDLLD